MNDEQRRAALVDGLRRAGMLSDPAVEAAMRAVPRHLFVPSASMAMAYEDRAIATKIVDGQAVSSISQPAIVAIMLEQLDVRPGMTVLEIGAGSGYNAALLAHLAGPGGRVTTIDLDQEIVLDARAHLAAAGASGVEVMLGDGGNGAPAGAPYDRIILTAGAYDISPALLAQLAGGGVLVLPLLLGLRQYAVAFERHGDALESRSLRACGFMLLRGAYAGPSLLAVRDGMQFGGPAISRVNLRVTRQTLAGPAQARTLPADVRVSDLIDFMALRHAAMLTVSTLGGMDDLGYALVADDGGSVALMPFGAENGYEPGPQVLLHGGDGAWRQLLERAGAFVAAGRPCLERAHVRAAPLAKTPGGGIGDLRKLWMAYHITYPVLE